MIFPIWNLPKIVIKKKIFLIAILLCFSQTHHILAQGPYNLSWWTVDGGGVTSSQSEDGTYTLSGTIGQAEAGVVMNDGSYALAGGVWGVGSEPSTTNPPPVGGEHDVYLPLVIKDS